MGRLDESLPLTVGEFEEWGNPKEKLAFDYMISYSPYDDITAKAYPNMLVKTSFNDSQVMYSEPAKYAAKMRATRTDHNFLLLKTNMAPAEHGDVSGRYDQLKEGAFDYAFILTRMGIANCPPEQQALDEARSGLRLLADEVTPNQRAG